MGSASITSLIMASWCHMLKPSFDIDASSEEKRLLGCVSKLAIKHTHNQLVCVTTGNSFLGAQIVKELLAHGYLVRVTIQNPVEFEDLKKMVGEEEMRKLESVVAAKMGNVESLCNAFRGCIAVFHTSSFIDPQGISGYSETMAFLEMEGARNVVEACGKEISVRRCVFTSSLLASIWVSNNVNTERAVIDESCWSDEEFCRENMFWAALGKTRAEKIAWQKSKEMKVNLVTICLGLIVAPPNQNSNKQPFFPYLKGAQVMLSQGNLATVDVKQAAEAHLHVFKAMDYGASGRYHCFDRLIRNPGEAVWLENELRSPGLLVNRRQDHYNVEGTGGSNLSNSKLVKLIANEASRYKSCKENEK